VTAEDGKATHMENHMSSVMKDTPDWLEKLQDIFHAIPLLYKQGIF